MSVMQAIAGGVVGRAAVGGGTMLAITQVGAVDLPDVSTTFLH